MSDLKQYMTEKIRLAADGTWFHGDTEITHQRTLDLFFKNVTQQNGKYVLTGEKQPVPIIVEDTAYFVRDLTRKTGGRYEVKLSNGEKEDLNPETLDVGSENQLYCFIKGGKLKARFDRKVYNELMKDLDEREGFYGLSYDGVFYPIKRVKDLQPTAEASATVAAKPTTAKSAPVKAKPVQAKPTKIKKAKAKKMKPKKNRAELKKLLIESKRRKNGATTQKTAKKKTAKTSERGKAIGRKVKTKLSKLFSKSKKA
jgi:hypothetical protein